MQKIKVITLKEFHIKSKKQLVRKSGDYIEFLLPTGSWSYWIREKELKDKKGLVKWIRHLITKRWVKRQTIVQLLDLL